MSRFKFKAWDKKNKLLIRPGQINLVKGELYMPDCIFLQFTGFTDMMGQEIYEEDILLIGETKHRAFWDEKALTWMYRKGSSVKPLNQKFTETTVRGYNAYERHDAVPD